MSLFAGFRLTVFLFLFAVVAAPLFGAPDRPPKDDAGSLLSEVERLQAVHEQAFARVDVDGAIAAAERQLEIRRALLGSHHPDTAASLLDLSSYLILKPNYSSYLARTLRSRDF